MAANMAHMRDTKWLTLEVCREFQRGTCSRSDMECKFAHPAKSCQVDNGRVIACFDSLKGRCSRENCKYLHPPPHLKTQLEINGRNNLIQQKNMAMLAQQMQLANAIMPGTQLQPMPMFSVAPSLAASPSAAAFSPYLGPKLMRTDRLEVCREYQRGNCSRGETDCRFAHPSDSTMIDTNDNTVTVCMDYIKGRCSREKCKYFHPPAHLQAKIKATQHQLNQAAAAAAMGMPPAVIPPLPKRPVLEKTNGATPLFNTGMFQYQQALANMQFPQHTAFIPSVPMVHGAPPATVSAASTSATSVPFATATANQDSPLSKLTTHEYMHLSQVPDSDVGGLSEQSYENGFNVDNILGQDHSALCLRAEKQHILFFRPPLPVLGVAGCGSAMSALCDEAVPGPIRLQSRGRKRDSK
ncbi:hypothetical protein COCON_G00088270 [Conger conger]|uniref:C3H1-type domain-containing protein n=1 Tax=Conger conger TaxID=82655 RepID=A0A9Q1DKH3_CONCO|nr:hypothetical protein COCON_G00088270 [Conger conger]